MTETLPTPGALLRTHGGELTLNPATSLLAAAWTWNSRQSQVLGAANSQLLLSNLVSSHPDLFFKSRFSS